MPSELLFRETLKVGNPTASKITAPKHRKNNILISCGLLKKSKICYWPLCEFAFIDELQISKI